MRKQLNGQRNRCAACGQYFNSNGAFDKHRVGSFEPPERRCLNDEEMKAKGMVLGEDGFWRGSEMTDKFLAIATARAEERKQNVKGSD